MFKRIIFDLDGVITSEERYWDCAALTVSEMLDQNIDFKKTETEVSSIRKKIFLDDKTIVNAKNLGVNTNYDLCFYTYCLLLLNGCNYVAACDFFKTGVKDFDDLCGNIEKKLGKDYVHKGKVWNKAYDIFQSWYLGNKKKSGLIKREKPLLEIGKLCDLFDLLLSHGISIGIATGRPWDEAVEPLINWDIFKYFDINLVSTYLDVMGVKKLFNKSVPKPHPYPYVKAALGKNFDDERILCGDYTINKDEVLAVGDSVADILSAKAAGMCFAAVLTGINGSEARSIFYEKGADFIFSNVLELSDLFI